MWKIIDKLHAKTDPEAVLKRRRFRYRIYGTLLILLGTFLLIPGVMEPQELAVPLLAGILGILIGVLTLWNSKAKKQQSKRFHQAAATLLKGLEAPPPVRVQFTQSGMKIADQQAVPYSDLNFAFETKDLFLLTWNEQVMILQKKDMITGSKEQFPSVLQDHIKSLQL